MQVLKPTTKEQLIHYLVNHISLGTYDKKFLSNVYEINKPLTTNQNELLDKIVLRYNKQFAKKELVATELVHLPWTRPLIVSSPQYTEAHISTKDDNICIRTPYKKDYILKLKDSKYPIVWDREERVWYTDYCAITLKYVIEQTEDHFNAVNYSEDIKEVIDYLAEYEDYKYWDPTLTYINDRCYLVSSNEFLYNAVHELLESITLNTLTKLVRYGIKVDDNVISNLPYNKELISFAIETQPTLEADDITTLVEYLAKIECDLIVVYNSAYFAKFLTAELADMLVDNNIKLMIVDRYQPYDIEEINKHRCTVFLTNNMRTDSISSIFTDKIIHLVNSKAPQQVKLMYETV
jgi:hypothetical protein